MGIWMGGAQASTTDCFDYLYNYWPFLSSTMTLKVADNTPHYPVGIGFLHLPAHNTAGFVMVSTFYMPTLPATILSPGDLGSKLDCQSFTSFTSFDNINCSLTLHHRQHQCQDIQIPLIVICGLLYTLPFHKPPSSDQIVSLQSGHFLHSCLVMDVTVSASINHLSHEQLHLLWHQHIGHLHSRCVSDMHNHVHGIPAVPLATDLDYCLVCAKAKLHKVAHGHASTRHATSCFQGLSIDFGFMVQWS